MDRYTVTGVEIETGAGWTYWDTFASHTDAAKLAESLNAAKKPVVRDCRAASTEGRS